MQDFAIRRTNMVNSQILPNRVTDERVIGAMLAMPREQFVPKPLQGVAYLDEDIPLEGGRFLMEPMVFARLLQAADVGPEDVVLDIACGTGYSTAVIARLASAVVALEQDEDMAARTDRRLTELGVDNAAVVTGNLSDGYPKQAPYDVIFINGAAEQVPAALLDQLNEGGRLAVVRRVGPIGQAVIHTKLGGLTATRTLFDAQLPVLPGFEAEAGFSF